MHALIRRRYDTSLLYFSHKNDYWTQAEMQSGCNISLGAATTSSRR